MTKLQGDEKPVQLAQLIRNFEAGLGGELILAAGFAGLRELPPMGDKYLAILMGAADSLGQAIGADMNETLEAIIIFLAKYPDCASVSKRMIKLMGDPNYREWVIISGQSAIAHASTGVNASEAYGALASRYVKSGGG